VNTFYEKIHRNHQISEQLFLFFANCAETFKQSYQHRFFWIWMYNIIKTKDVEKVLNSTKHLDKSRIYELFHPFLKTGLLTSSDKKHLIRRRMLTRTFHFEILKEFLEIFERENDKLVDKLKQNVGIQLNIIPIASDFAFNMICGGVE
jgi:cytochrome P450 family 4